MNYRSYIVVITYFTGYQQALANSDTNNRSEKELAEYIYV